MLFSGTLAFHFYRDTLGLPGDTGWLDVDGPFRAEQLTVRVASHVSTRWRDRDRSLEPIADLIAAQYATRPGNYLGFLSSFDYLGRVVALMQTRHPDVPVWAQAPGMAESERDAFRPLRRRRARRRLRGAGRCVLGRRGPGERLIGAFIATLGLPQVNDVNEQMRRAMDARFGNGYDYMYLYPGLQKVGGRARDPHRARRRCRAPDRRPLPTARSARSAAAVVADRVTVTVTLRGPFRRAASVSAYRYSTLSIASAASCRCGRTRRTAASVVSAPIGMFVLSAATTSP